jgi:hypothetical protein
MDKKKRYGKRSEEKEREGEFPQPLYVPHRPCTLPSTSSPSSYSLSTSKSVEKDSQRRGVSDVNTLRRDET